MFLLIPQTKNISLDTGGIKPTLMMECRYPVYSCNIQAEKFPFTVEAINKVSIKLSNGQTYIFSTENGSILWDKSNNPNPEPVYFKGDDGCACTLTFNYKKPEESDNSFDAGFISVYATIDLPENIETLEAIMIVSSKNKKTYTQKNEFQLSSNNSQTNLSTNSSQTNGSVWFSRNGDNIVIYKIDKNYKETDLVKKGNTLSNYNFYSTFFVFSEETNNKLKSTSPPKYYGLKMGVIDGYKQYGYQFLLPDENYNNIIKDNNLKAFYEECRNTSPPLEEQIFSYARLKRNSNDVIEIQQNDCKFFLPITEKDLEP